jgi:hypothetical protein
MLGSSWVAAQLAASQEGLSSVSRYPSKRGLGRNLSRPTCFVVILLQRQRTSVKLQILPALTNNYFPAKFRKAELPNSNRYFPLTQCCNSRLLSRTTKTDQKKWKLPVILPKTKHTNIGNSLCCNPWRPYCATKNSYFLNRNLPLVSHD